LSKFGRLQSFFFASSGVQSIVIFIFILFSFVIN
jgi:hypothetical protein